MVVPKPRESMLEADGRVAVLTFLRDDVRNAPTGTALVDDLLQTAGRADAEMGIAAGFVVRRRGRLSYEILSVTQF